MSDIAQETQTFFSLYGSGHAPADAIHDFIEAWHETGDDEQRPLSEYLGMTAEEFGVWVITPRVLPVILAARRANRPLAEFVRPFVEKLRADANPNDRSVLFALGHWLAAHPPA